MYSHIALLVICGKQWLLLLFSNYNYLYLGFLKKNWFFFLKFLKKILIFLCKVRLKNMKYEMDFQKKYILVDFMWFLCRFMWFLVHSRWQNARPFLCCFSNFHAPSRLIGQIMAYENLKNYQTDKKAVFGGFLRSFMAVFSVFFLLFQ